MPSIALPVSLRGQLLSGIRAPVAVFSPADLFATGSQGIWLDPSDLSTMFSDRAGTTPVTTPGTVVGLRLDKSKGLKLGSELVTNPGGPFVNTTGWLPYLTGSNFSVVGGNLVAVDDCYFPVAGVTVGKTYQVDVSVVSGAGIDLYPNNDPSGVAYYIQRNGTFSARVRTVNNALTIYVNPNTTIASVSVRELAGNHAVAPTDAARPTYGIEPKGGRRNLLTWSEDFGNAVWQVNRAAKGAAQLDPNGGMTAIRVTATSANGDFYTVVTAANVTHANSLWIRRVSGTGDVQAGNPGNGFSTVAVTSSWQRFSTSGLPASGTTLYLAVRMLTSGDVIDVAFAQAELGSTATAYQRVTTAYDVTESGVATCHYVQYDGSDDSMSTSAIDFTGTDKMSVFAGVRKLSDAGGLGALIEFSANAPNAAGTIGLYASISSAANYYGFSRGTSTAEVQTANTFAAPHSAILTSESDISGDIYRLRVNGTVAGTSTANQGTGNYLANSVFIGRRGNSNLPFNGKDFGIIVVGKAASGTEITDTETWLAARTSGVSI